MLLQTRYGQDMGMRSLFGTSVGELCQFASRGAYGVLQCIYPPHVTVTILVNVQGMSQHKLTVQNRSNNVSGLCATPPEWNWLVEGAVDQLNFLAVIYKHKMLHHPEFLLPSIARYVPCQALVASSSFFVA